MHGDGDAETGWLADNLAQFRSLFNDNLIDLTRTGKYAWISGGVVVDTSLGDVHFAISSGPYTIPVGATQRVAFAVLGGDGLADLKTNADAAQLKWNDIKLLLGVPEEASGLPAVYALRQNYPNPFNPSTVISYDLPEASVVTLRVVNILGQEVASLLVNQSENAGTHHVRFEAGGLASGVYFYQIHATSSSAGAAGAFSDAKKLLLVR